MDKRSGAGERITLIDTHHHLWDLDRNYYPWLSDEPLPHFFLGNYDALKHNFLPEDYRREDIASAVARELHWVLAELGVKP